MATEYKLNYTASEINEKLGKIGAPVSWNDLADKPFGVTTELVEIVPEQSVTKAMTMPNFYQAPTLFGDYKFVEGKTYVIKVNDNEFKAIPIVQGANILVGNGYLMSSRDFEDTGEPFVIWQSGNFVDFYWSKELGETITLEIFEPEVVQQLDSKFVNNSQFWIIPSNDGKFTCNRTLSEFMKAMESGMCLCNVWAGTTLMVMVRCGLDTNDVIAMEFLDLVFNERQSLQWCISTNEISPLVD